VCVCACVCVCVRVYIYICVCVYALVSHHLTHTHTQLASAGTATFYVDDVALVANSQPVYTNALASGWADWSWPTGAANFASTALIRSSSTSIAVTLAQWQALSFHSNTVLSSSAYSGIRCGWRGHAVWDSVVDWADSHASPPTHHT
jgi:hypothetical protein